MSTPAAPATSASSSFRLRRVVPFALAATYLWMVAVLAIWVLGPSLGFGWKPILVDAGSMEPVIRTGDIVLVAETDTTVYLRGEVITYADPVWEGELVTHRIVATLPDGMYRTRGDASAVNDSTPIPHRDVLGSGRLLIPKIGLPVIWLSQAPVALAIWIMVTLSAWVIVLRLTSLGFPVGGAAGDTRPQRLAGKVLRPRPVASLARRWGPVVVSTAAAVPLIGSVGPVMVVWPLAILMIDPRGPHLRIGRVAAGWASLPLLGRVRPLPLTAGTVVVLTCTLTLVSTATFTAAAANPTNSFGLDTLDPVTGLTATENCTGPEPDVTLDWTPSVSSNVTGYRVLRDGALLMTVVPGSSTTFTDTSAANTASYTYEVVAYATSWQSASQSVSITTACPTGPPTTGIIPSDGSGEYTITIPPTVQAGDYMLVYINANSDKFTPAAGWTQEAAKNDGGKNSHVRLYGRVATAGDPGSTYVFSSDDGGSGIATMVAYSGIDTNDPVGGTSISSYGSTTAPEAKGQNPTFPDSTVVAFWELSTPAVLTPPASLNTRISGSANARTMLVADNTFSSDTGDFVASSDTVGDGTSISVLLNPAPGAAPEFGSALAGYGLPGPGGSLDSATDSFVGGANGRLDTASLVEIGSGHLLQPAAANAYLGLRAAAQQDLGLDLSARITDSYRTFEQQVSLAAVKGLYSQGGLAAEPGTSNHGLGLALDIDTSGGVGAWLSAHAPRYGFTTIPREPWHWEFTLD